MFTKLLAINMVANNFLGLSKRLEIIFIRLGFSSRPLSISDFVNEKKATSAPEIKAELTNKSSNKRNPTIMV